MSIFSGISSFFRRRQRQQRGYQQLAALGAQNSDWVLSFLGEDADVKQNILALRSRSRDLWKSNPYFAKYREELWANVFGEHGISLRMKVKETEDRVVHTADEKTAIALHENRVNRVRAWLATKTGNRINDLVMTRMNDRGQAQVIAGQVDVFANQIIERRWNEWKRGEFCDIRGRRSYTAIQQLRLMSAARDGDFMLLMVEGKGVNKFGFTLQLINAEWCDQMLNYELPNGNEIRMGIEYGMTPMGLGAPVAYHFIKRRPRDWEYSIPSLFQFQPGVTHERVDAAKIIHYARYVDSDSTRPAPWCAPIIPKARQLDAYELAEVIAARTAACKMGFFYSDLIPEGGEGVGIPDPEKINQRAMGAEPGGFHGLPYGVKFQGFDPSHPNGNFDGFRKGMLRSMCAGLPGANYNIIANDAEGVSYSTGRIFSLDDRELWKLIQRWDIDTAERPIFERWLQMSLTTGAVPLPLVKYTKLNQPHFAGRRWSWVDPARDAKANHEQLILGLTSRSRLCEDAGVDLEDVLFELAEEEMLIQELGLNAISLDSLTATPNSGTPEKPDEEEVEDEPKAPKKKPAKVNGKRLPALS